MLPISCGARVALAIVLGTVLPPLSAQAQKTEPLTEARVRAFLKAARAEADADDPGSIVLGLDKRVRERWGDFETFPISILRREELNIILTTPYMGFRRGLADRLRFFQPIDNVPWVDAAVIAVDRLRTDPPDIVSVQVRRNGKEIPPLKNLLRPMTFVNGRGEQVVAHAGEVQFPMSAFAPGAGVTITATPQDGSPFVVTLEDAQLRMLR